MTNNGIKGKLLIKGPGNTHTRQHKAATTQPDDTLIHLQCSEISAELCRTECYFAT